MPVLKQITIPSDIWAVAVCLKQYTGAHRRGCLEINLDGSSHVKSVRFLEAPIGIDDVIQEAERLTA